MATTSPSIVTMKLTLIGAPTDIGASVAGCRLGPGALRVAGIEKALRAFGVDVRDAGDVIGPSNPQSPPVDGYRHLPEVIEWNRAVRDAVAAELADGRMPVLMGGGGIVTTFAVFAVSFALAAGAAFLLPEKRDAGID